LAIDPSVRAVMSKINKKSGPGTVILGSDIAQPVRSTITSGSLNIDVALGGGWATNHWIEIIGHPSSGKTLLVLKTIAANQKVDPNWTTVWFAAEDFVDSYAEMLGVDTSRVIVEEENQMEAVYQHAIDFLDTKAVDCLVIDSLPALVPVREDAATMEDFQPGLAAFLTGKFFRKSNPSMKRSLTVLERPVTGFVINQWRSKIGGYGDPRTAPGGQGKDFFFFQRVDVRRDEWLSNTRGEPIGQTIKVVNLKNKYARPGRIGQIDAYISRGNGFEAGDFDLVKDVVSAGLAYEVIERPDKSHYTFGTYRWYGRPAVDEAIRTDVRLRRQLRKAVLAAAAAPLPAPVQAPKQRKTPPAAPKPAAAATKTVRRPRAPR